MRDSWPSNSLLPGRASGPWDITLSTGVCLVVALALAPVFGWALAHENWLLVGLLLMVAVVPLVIRWPVVSTFGLYALIVPFDTVASLAESGGATLTRLVGIAAGGVLLAAGLVERRLGRPPLAALWWGLFTVWGIISATWALDPDLTLGRLPTTLSLMALFFIAVCFRPSRKELYLVCLLAVAGGVVAAATAYLYGVEAAAVKATARVTLRVGEQSSNPNAFGGALILPVALAMAGFVGWRNPMHKLVAAAALVMLGTGIYMTKSRGALVAFLITMLVFFVRSRVRWQALVPIAVLLGLIVVLPEAFFARAGMLLSGEDATGAGRTEVWSTGLGVLDDVGVIGVGLANYTLIYQFADAWAVGVKNKGAHNSYLAAWVELGIPGIVLLLAALGSHLLAVRGVNRAALRGAFLPALEAACFGMMASAFFSDRLLLKFFWLPWILLTWAIYTARGTEQARAEQAKDDPA